MPQPLNERLLLEAYRGAGSRLREARKKAGFSSAEGAAKRHGWTESTYRSHENGQTPVPVEAALSYACAFHVAPYWILMGDGDMHSVDAMLVGASTDIKDKVRSYAEYLLNGAEEPRLQSRG